MRIRQICLLGTLSRVWLIHIFTYIQYFSRKVSEQDRHYQYETVISHFRRDGAAGMTYSGGNMWIRIVTKESTERNVKEIENGRSSVSILLLTLA